MKILKKPNFTFEKKLWRKGYKLVAGLDEVGRGCFAGPVVAAAVVFSSNILNTKYKILNSDVRIDDSKKLTENMRNIAGIWIKKNALTWGVGEANVVEINRLGLGSATNVAFRKAIAQVNRRLHNRIQYLLIDAFYVPYVRGFPTGIKKVGKIKKRKEPVSRQLAIVNGDEKSISIASASIIAKVYRDELMKKIGSKKRYLIYGWVNNKGYATEFHRKAIIKFGTTIHHRRKFVDTYISKLEERK